MNQLVYYIIKAFVYGLSSLPFFILHGISTFLYWNVYYIFDYRKKVVWDNLKRSFPEKTDKELKAIQKEFYKHFCDIMIESLKAFTMSKKAVEKRHAYKNPELVQALVSKGHKVALIAPHYNNWEWCVLSFNLIDQKQNPLVLIMYAVLKNANMEKLVRKSRTRMGTDMFPKKDTVRNVVKHKDEPFLLGFAADQAPHNPYNSYWMEFLGQETGVFYGVEKLSKAYDMIPVYCHIRKVGRSRYETEFELITDNPAEAPYGFITEQHMKLLENDIKKEPAYWLWTHKRWKKSKPADFDEKRKTQKA